MDDGQHFRCTEPKMITGKIKNLNIEKGYGFIKAENGDEFFFHMSGLANCFMKDLKTDMLVEFESTRTPKGLRAERITVVTN